MGRRQTRSREDILEYGRNYYAKTKEERKSEFNLVAKRGYYKNKLKTETDEAKLQKYQAIVDEAQTELDNIRAERWAAKRAAGKGQYKRDVIGENTHTVQ